MIMGTSSVTAQQELFSGQKIFKFNRHFYILVHFIVCQDNIFEETSVDFRHETMKGRSEWEFQRGNYWLSWNKENQQMQAKPVDSTNQEKVGKYPRRKNKTSSKRIPRDSSKQSAIPEVEQKESRIRDLEGY